MRVLTSTMQIEDITGLFSFVQTIIAPNGLLVLTFSHAIFQSSCLVYSNLTKYMVLSVQDTGHL